METETQTQVFFNVPLKRLEPIFKQWVKDVIPSKENEPAPTPQEDPLNDFIPKTEVRGKFASSSTLWKYEKQGKLKAYGFGGKRYYKRSELLAAFEEVKVKGGCNE